MQVAASLDSMVVGEREIITQVRAAYERCQKMGLTGDMIRLVIKNVILTAKEVFTKTGIAEKPVSVVSLAFRRLRSMNIQDDARFAIVGAGETNTNLLKYLAKHVYKNFVIFNRTLSKAEALAESVKEGTAGKGGIVKALPLEKLSEVADVRNGNTGFDVLITCTGSSLPLITEEVFLSMGEKPKVVIDMAMPADVDEKLIHTYKLHYIGLNQLKEQAQRNLQDRHKQIEAAEAIVAAGINEFNAQHRTRKVELKMQQVPEKIREIKSKALNDVFAEEVAAMDEKSRQLLTQVMDYMEKKYISVPMVMAKEIILDQR
jgi:glutamyl-tRNA reductase